MSEQLSDVPISISTLSESDLALSAINAPTAEQLASAIPSINSAVGGSSVALSTARALNEQDGYIDPNGNFVRWNNQISNGVYYPGQGGATVQPAFAETPVTAAVLGANPELWPFVVAGGLTLGAGVGVGIGLSNLTNPGDGSYNTFGDFIPPVPTFQPSMEGDYNTYLGNGGNLSPNDWVAFGKPDGTFIGPPAPGQAPALPSVPGAPIILPGPSNPEATPAPAFGDSGLPASPLSVPDLYTNPATQFNYLNYLANGGQRSFIDFIGAGQPSADEEILGTQAAPSSNVPNLTPPGITLASPIGFNGPGPITNAALGVYQDAYNTGYANAQARWDAGQLILSEGQQPETVIGQEADAFARFQLNLALQPGGMLENYSDDILVNRYLRDPSGTGFTIPDIQIPSEGVIIDGTIGYKDVNTPQVQRFFDYSPNTNSVIIVTPGQSPVFIPRR